MIVATRKNDKKVTLRENLKSVPAPLQTPVKVCTSGYTSTLESIHIEHVGMQIPATYSGDTMANTEGFSWYVSQHYALKTDFTPEQATETLVLLELAFPHYVETFGELLPDIDQLRQAVIYGKNRHTMLDAMLDDHQHGGYGYGGITQEGYVAAYQSPSNPWHARYIVLHECVHLYQYCMRDKGWSKIGHWYVEGVAQTLSQHVYDPDKKQLTIHTDSCLGSQGGTTIDEIFKKEKLTFQKMCEKACGNYPAWADIAFFLRSTPEWYVKFGLLQSEAIRRWDGHSDQTKLVAELTQEIYGPWSTMNAKHRKWLKQPRRTFHQEKGIWDQHGDTAISYANNRVKDSFATAAFAFAPGETPEAAPHLMAFPIADKPATVGEVARGVEEPVIGCEIDFSIAAGKGAAGFALGRSARKDSKILIDQATKLVIQLEGAKAKTVALPASMVKAIKKNRSRFGLTVTIGKKQLIITVAAGNRAITSFTSKKSITPAQRKKLMSKPMAIVSQNANHAITPFVDDGRAAVTELDTERPANRWGAICMPQLNRVYRAWWPLRTKKTPLLSEAKDLLLGSVEKSADEQQAAIKSVTKSIPAIVKEIAAAKASQAAKDIALRELAGIKFDITFETTNSKKTAVTARAVVTPAIFGAVTGTVSLAPAFGPVKTAAKGEKLIARANKSAEIKRKLTLPEGNPQFALTGKYVFSFHGQKVELNAQFVGNEGIDTYKIIGPFTGTKYSDEVAADTAKTEIEKGEFGFEKRHRGLSGNCIKWQDYTRPHSTPVDRVTLLHMVKEFGNQADESIAYALVNVESARDCEAVLSLGSNDGVVAWLNDKPVHEFYKRRDWRHREDRAKIRLRKGSNKLVFKLFHYGALWYFSASIEDKQGLPMKGVSYNLDIKK